MTDMQIAMLREIESGKTVAEIAVKYGVWRSTVRYYVNKLIGEGMVERRSTMKVTDNGKKVLDELNYRV